jgi:hypothetical protein
MLQLETDFASVQSRDRPVEDTNEVLLDRARMMSVGTVHSPDNSRIPVAVGNRGTRGGHHIRAGKIPAEAHQNDEGASDEIQTDGHPVCNNYPDGLVEDNGRIRAGEI